MASTLISTDDVVSFLETDKIDSEVEILIDSADKAIRDVYGPHVDGNRDVRLSDTYGFEVILPYPPAAMIAEIREYSNDELSSAAEVVPEDEYELENGGRIVRRPEKAFGQRLIVSYTPVDDSSERKHILVDLIRLADQYEGVKMEEIGAGQSSGVSTEHLDYVVEWNRILNRMRPFEPGILFV